MIYTCSTDAALKTRAKVEGYPTMKRDYFLKPPVGTAGPQAFLVEQEPNEVIRPHFHAINQFQVIVHGGGTLGRKEVAPATVQYADAYTGYGPIVSRDDGIFYFTLRPTSADPTGPWYLPESKEEQQKRPNPPRNQVGVVAVLDDPVTSAAVEEVIAAEDDGLRTDAVTLASGGQWDGWEDGRGGGYYLLVLSGLIEVDGESFDQWSCVYVEEEGPEPQVAGGEHGGQFLAMRFPIGS